MTERTIHEGRNVKRIREILGMKQDTLAFELGLSQQAISQLEQKEALDKELLEKVAKVLKVNPEAIANFSEEATMNFISTTFNHEHSTVSYQSIFNLNPFEKIIELYEALLRSEREKIALLEKR